MRPALLEFVRCPSCRGRFVVDGGAGRPVPALDPRAALGGEPVEFDAATLSCTGCGARVPIRDGVPRLTELAQHGREIVDEHTRQNFSFEWMLYRPEDGTWGMTLDDRTKWYFLKGVGLEAHEVAGKRVLDAGCGNGSSTLGIARLGAVCVGIDLSSGVERAKEHFEPRDSSTAALYVQGNLMDAPFERESFDVVFSAGVLHHTPDTRKAFMGLAPLVKPGGRFYMWLYRHAPVVTPLLTVMRAATTRVPPNLSVLGAIALAPAFQAFTRTMTATGLRHYGKLTWRACALALLDIFGARYAHAHSFDEVAEWYAEAGFEAPRLCSFERRGFGVCATKRS